MERGDCQRVLQLLDEAFPGGPPSGGSVANRGEEFEIHDPEMHRGAHWRRIDSCSFRDCEQLYYLTPHGFSLYLPGFLRCAIEALDDEVWRDKAPYVCEHLTRYDVGAPLASHQEKQFRALNARQAAAVAAVLLLLEREGVREATAALDSHWRQLASRG